MEKIIVIGSPGAGKSSFSKKLKNITKLPLYHIDMLYHKKDGTHITKEELEEKLKEIFKTDKWIIDGNYQKTLELRINECDTIFLLDFPTQVCLEVAKLEYDEWADNKEENRKCRIERKKEKIYNAFNDEFFCKLILVDNNKLIGFISIFPKDCEEEKELKPWYATMYVKKEYRKKGYSRILNDAILKEAKNRGFTTIYLKTDLKNYYEKFGAIFIKKLKTGETLYKFEL